MASLREWAVRFWATLRRRRADADLEEELRLHLDLAAEDARRRSDTPADGERESRGTRLRAGGLPQAMDALRDQRGLPWLDGLTKDLGYAARTIARSPGFSLVAILTLASGLALCVSVLAVVNAYVIRSFPYPAADRLYQVEYRAPGQHDSPRGLEAIDWRALDDVAERRIAWDLDMFYLLGGEYPEQAPGAWVTPDFLDGLGLRIERGRAFEPLDFTASGPPPVIISQRIWEERFNRDPEVVGRALRAYVSDRPDEPEALVVIGVLSADVWHTNRYTDILAPLRAESYPYLLTLREGVDEQSAARRVAEVVRSGVSVSDDWRPRLTQLQARYVESMRPILGAVGMSAALVLLIGYANVAVLLLVRAVKRRQEIAVRLALGASRGRLVRLLGLEALLLSGCAAILGTAAGLFLTRTLAPAIEEYFSRRLPGGADALAIDGTMLAAAVAGGAILTIGMTLVPLVTLWSTPVVTAMKSGGRGTTDGRAAGRLRSALIGLEIAAALTLLVGSALMIETTLRLLRADHGIRTEDVVATGFGLRARAYPDATARAALLERLLERVEAEAGRTVGLSDNWALQTLHPRRVETAGDAPRLGEAAVIRVNASYFDALGIAIRDGEPFAPHQRYEGHPVAVISEGLAARLWPGERAVGRYFRMPVQDDDSTAEAHLVIGVAAGVRPLDASTGQARLGPDQEEVYTPILRDSGRFAFVYVPGPNSAAVSIRSILARLDPEVAVNPPRFLAEALEDSRLRPRSLAWLLSGLAGLACLLALLGVSSVIAYSIRQREREIGVRLVVGADARAISRLFVREGTPLVALGLAAGVAGAFALGRVLESQLFGVAPAEPRVLAAATLLFAACGWLALWLPARRAAGIDPATVLRSE